MTRRIPHVSLLVALAVSSCLGSSVPRVPGHTGRLELEPAGASAAGLGPLAVVAAGPHGDLSAETEPGVTLVFNRPLREMDQAEPAAAPKELQLRSSTGTAVPGRFRWVGTHGVLFEPEQPLPLATRFHVVAQKGLRALDGATLAEDYRFEFNTELPRLVTSVPSDRFRQAKPTDPIRLCFSQKVAPEMLERHARLTRVFSDRSGEDEIAFRVTAEEQREATSARHWLTLVPQQPLPADSDLSLTISPGLTSQEGPLPTRDPITWTAHTHGPLRLDQVLCPRPDLGRCEAHRDVTLVLSTPVTPDELRRHVHFSGKYRAARPNPKAKVPNTPTTNHPLRLDPEYGDRFRVTLDAGLRDVFGQTLGKEVRFDVAIEEPFLVPDPKKANSPQQPLASAGPAPAPDQPRRPKLHYALEFGVTGQVFEALAGRDGAQGPLEHRVPIGSINLASYGLRSWANNELSTVYWLGRQRGGQGPSGAEPAFTWITPQAAASTRAVHWLDVDATLGGPGKLGVSMLQAQALGASYPESRLLTITDLGISARISRFGSVAWVTHLSTGNPASGAEVLLYDKNGHVLAKHQADAAGLVDFSASELVSVDKNGNADSSMVLVARLGDDWTFQRVEPASSVRPIAWVDQAQKSHWRGLVFTDRGVYRPGESLKVSGFFRRTQQVGFDARGGQEVEYRLTDAAGEVVAVGKARLDTHATLALDLPIPKSIALGQGNITIRLGRKYDESFSAPFQILDYKPAEFKVGVQPLQAQAVRGQLAEFHIHSEYLFGAPVANARVLKYVSRSIVDFAPPEHPAFVFNDDAFRRDLTYVDRTGRSFNEEDHLDAAGTDDSQVPLDNPKQISAERVLLEAEVQDISAQTQTGRASVLVHPAEFYVGVGTLKGRFFAVGAKLSPDLVLADPSGKHVAGVPIRLQLLRRNWTRAIEDRRAESLYYNSRVHDEPAGECQVTSGASAVRCQLRVPRAGHYILRAEATDRLGNTVASSRDLYALEDRADGGEAVGFRAPDRRKLTLELDQKLYEPGQTAKLLIQNPFSAGTALVTVERGGIFERRIVELAGPMPVVEIPVKADYFPNAFVSVQLLRGRTARMEPATDLRAADVGAPQYRVGYAELHVNPESRRLRLEIESDKAEYQPGQVVEADLTLRTTEGQPSSGSVTFYVVDEGVLELTGYHAPDPIPAFSEARTLGVYPIESRENLARILALKPGERFGPLGWQTPPGAGSEYDGDKGDEVGDGDSGRLRAEFRTTVYFEAGRQVDASGKTHFSFKLPDNLTSFRLMAVAASHDRFGFAEHSVVSNKPLMARPLLPRILRVGDTLQPGVVVTSLGAATGPASVAMKTTGLAAKGPAKHDFSLTRGGQSEQRFEVTAKRAGEVAFEFDARSGKLRDRVRLTKEVTQPVHWLSAADYGVLAAPDGSAEIALGDLKGVRADLGGLDVQLSPSALVGLAPIFEHLRDYPYGCTEQLASRVLPMLAASGLARQQNVVLDLGRSEWIDEALGQIVNRQIWNGGFGYWEGDHQQVPWLSAYVLLALERASASGYFVPRDARQRGASLAQQTLYQLLSEVRTHDDGEGQSKTEDDDGRPVEEPNEPAQLGLRRLGPEQQQRLRLAQAVFIADVLSSVGAARRSDLQELLGHSDEMSLSTRIQLLHAMASAQLPQQTLDALLENLLEKVSVGPFEAHVEAVDPALDEMFESSTRSTAWLLRAALAVSPDHPVASKLARGLIGLRKHATYRNTQEDAWALLALEEYRVNREQVAPDVTASVRLGDGETREFPFRGLPLHTESVEVPTIELRSAEPNVLSLSAEGTTPVYYAVTLEAAKDGGAARAVDAGMAVDKRMRGLEPAELQTAARSLPSEWQPSAALGQLVLVDILLESAEPRTQIVIDDPLPAGLEAVEFGFETTTQALSTASNARARSDEFAPDRARWGSLQRLEPVHREMHDDRVLLFLPAIDAGIYHLRYLARATTPGRFVMPATKASCMYEPEVFGQTRARTFDVRVQR